MIETAEAVCANRRARSLGKLYVYKVMRLKESSATGWGMDYPGESEQKKLERAYKAVRKAQDGKKSWVAAASDPP